MTRSGAPATGEAHFPHSRAQAGTVASAAAAAKDILPCLYNSSPGCLFMFMFIQQGLLTYHLGAGLCVAQFFRLASKKRKWANLFLRCVKTNS